MEPHTQSVLACGAQDPRQISANDCSVTLPNERGRCGMFERIGFAYLVTRCLHRIDNIIRQANSANIP